MTHQNGLVIAYQAVNFGFLLTYLCPTWSHRVEKKGEYLNREEWGRREEIGGKGRGMGEIRRREVTRMRERGRRKRERKRERREKRGGGKRERKRRRKRDQARWKLHTHSLTQKKLTTTYHNHYN